MPDEPQTPGADAGDATEYQDCPKSLRGAGSVDLRAAKEGSLGTFQPPYTG